ncbi:16S rRNA (cytosine(1402)-N(4))-methyltransferase RsmH [Candidatus Falkowbacteria bacterium]|nr:16S rRNA (cytosine(1402)-N(4))-methyltransferase RsmH [Candidatus Falkowbacteria bacterium]NCT54676.1 16S rRNA (cytosine(1402)-N(4))-methyltransferase RsmH [Candidatus Falkowbacteria bacterium]
MIYSHVPVMLKEIISFLDPKIGGKFIDCTLGGAGYTRAIAELVGEKGKVLGIDLDELALENAKRLLKEKKLNNVELVRSNFKNLNEVAESVFPGELVDGIVFDLGLSSAQLDDEARGFSFKGERALDMSFGPDNELSTEKIVNFYSLLELTKIFREYGEEKQAYRIAKKIVETRKKKKIKTTSDLCTLIEEIIPIRAWSKIHPATKVFQALRMETNKELEVLAEALEQAEKRLKIGGRLVVVSFHSGEDRIVKNFLRDRKGKDFNILTKKPLIPGSFEASCNKRARSAKLRAAQKI